MSSRHHTTNVIPTRMPFIIFNINCHVAGSSYGFTYISLSLMTPSLQLLFTYLRMHFQLSSSSSDKLEMANSCCLHIYVPTLGSIKSIHSISCSMSFCNGHFLTDMGVVTKSATYHDISKKKKNIISSLKRPNAPMLKLALLFTTCSGDGIKLLVSEILDWDSVKVNVFFTKCKSY